MDGRDPSAAYLAAKGLPDLVVKSHVDAGTKHAAIELRGLVIVPMGGLVPYAMMNAHRERLAQTVSKSVTAKTVVVVIDLMECVAVRLDGLIETVRRHVPRVPSVSTAQGHVGVFTEHRAAQWTVHATAMRVGRGNDVKCPVLRVSLDVTARRYVAAPTMQNATALTGIACACLVG